MFVTSPHQLTHAEHEKIPSIGVFSCSASFLHPATHAEHKETPRLGDTIVGVFALSASILHPAMHAEHEETPPLVSFRARHLFYTQRHTPNTRRHHHWCHTQWHMSNMKRHLRWCLFVLCAYPASPDARRVVCPHCSTNLFSTTEGLAPSLNIICILLQIK